MERQILVGGRVWMAATKYYFAEAARTRANAKRAEAGKDLLPTVWDEVAGTTRKVVPASKPRMVRGHTPELRGGIGSLERVKMVGKVRKLQPGPVGKLGKVVEVGTCPPPGPWLPPAEGTACYDKPAA